jgi:2-polyprenyl-3-methyl-5-hydroxy-6-metoxy-1,4-benzoquinol methylase
MATYESSIYEDGAYLDKNPGWHEEDSPWKAQHVSRMWARNQLVPQRVAEIGCGAGEILSCLAREHGAGMQFVGYDISPQAIELCAKKAQPHLRFELKNLLEETVEPFDVMLAIDVIEHVEDCYGFLRKLRPKATYKIFHIPLDLSAQTVLRSEPILHVRRVVGHIHYYNKDLALATLRDTGYEVLDHFYTCTRMELPNLPWQAQLMRWPRQLAFAVSPDLAARALGGWSLMVLTR